MQGIFKNEWTGSNCVIVSIATCFEVKFFNAKCEVGCS